MTTLREEMTPESFGKNLKSIRKFLGLTQAELAKRAGITPAAISQIEDNKRTPSLETACKLIKTLNVPFERLVQ